MKIKVLVLGKIHHAGINLLKDQKNFEIILEEDKPKNLLETCKKINAVIVRMTPIDQNFIDASKNLKIVSRHGVGYNTVNVDKLTENNIPLFITGDVNSTAVAEHAFSMMISYTKNIIEHNNAVINQNFKIRDSYKALELFGKKILIIGYGRIGIKFANLCKAFGMKVLVADKYLDKSKVKYEVSFSNKFEDFLADADFISLHTPHETGTPPMFGKKQFKIMKSNSVIINTSRGDLIDEIELIKALKKKIIGGACLDVFNPEPPSNKNFLLSSSNVILSPHSAAYTKEAIEKMSLSCCKNVISFFLKEFDQNLIVNYKDIKL